MVKFLAKYEEPESPRKILVVFFFLCILFTYFWLHWVFVAGHGFSLVAAGGGFLLAVHMLLLLQSTVSNNNMVVSSCSTQA